MSVRPSHIIPAWIAFTLLIRAIKRWTTFFAPNEESDSFELPANAFRVKTKLEYVVLLNIALLSALLTVATFTYLPHGSVHLPSPYFFVYTVLLIVFHEWSHALGWMLGGLPKRNIQFGIMWTIFAPFAHADVATSMRVYRFALALPTFTTGLLPVGVAWYLRDFDLAGCALLAGISGDLLMLAASIAFHPSDLAFVVLNKGHST